MTATEASGTSTNKNASQGWPETTGRQADMLLTEYGSGGWSVAVNQSKIGPGTIGWIVRYDGSWGHIAGCLAAEYAVDPEQSEADGAVYAYGTLFPWPREWWIDGARLHLDGWTSPPFGRSPKGARIAQLPSGRRLPPDDLARIEQHLHPVIANWVARRHPPP